MPTWLLVALALTLIDRRVNRHRSKWTHLFRAIPLLAATALGGIMAETVKLLVRRQRPEFHDGAYGFRPFSDNPFNGSGLGMASSHTAVAFAAAFVLTRMHPAAAPVWYFIAAGTGLSRVVDGGHFLSDVWVGAALGLVAGNLVWGWHVKLNRGDLVEMGVMTGEEATRRRGDEATRAGAPGDRPSAKASARPRRGPAGGMGVDTMRLVDKYLGVPACAVLTLCRRLVDVTPPPDDDGPRRIVFIKLAEQGSTVLAHATLRRATEIVGRENVYFLAFEENRFILDLMDIIPRENVIEIRTGGLSGVVRGALGALRTLRALRIDTVIDLEFFARSSACLAFLMGARCRVGFHAYGGEGPWRGDLMTHRLRFNAHLHTTQTFRLMLEALDRDPRVLPTFDVVPRFEDGPPPPFEPSDEESAAIRRRLAELAGGAEAGRLVLLNPNCSDLLPLRAWPYERYVELAGRLLDADPDLHIGMTGGPGEADAVAALVDEVGDPRCFNLAGRTTLRELLVVYTVADVLVTNDSGPAHFATLTPVDVVTLFGPETPNLFAARSPRNHVLWAGLACSPCVSAFNNRTSPCTDNRCMQAIDVEQVYDVVTGILDGRRSGLPVWQGAGS